MSPTFCFILLASVAVSAITSFRQHNECPRARPVPGHTATTGKTCGISAIPPILSSPSVPNLQGGYPAVAHSWPWVVSVQYRDFVIGTEWDHMCAGTLVSPRLIIMDGMCRMFKATLGASSPFNWLVILGAQNNSVAANINNSVTIESFRHRETGGYLRYQGVIKLSNDVLPEYAFTNSICVDEAVSFALGYTDCFTAGWDGNGKHLHQAQMMLVSLEQYRNETGNTIDGPAITAVVISTSGFPSWRELGQPLMCRSWCNRAEGQWFLVGVATGYKIRKGRYDNKTYAFFNKYTKSRQWYKQQTIPDFLALHRL